MSHISTIEWTDSTWNPVTGCTKVSPGCKNCYAETFAERFRGVKGHPYEQGFDLRLWPDRLELPLKWKDPRRIFVNSMSDLFHERIPDEYIMQVFEVMIKADHHVFQVLTKRSTRLKEWTRRHFRAINQLDDGRRILPAHIWLGVSVETQKYVRRTSDLQAVPAHVRFISVEPLLDEVLLKPTHLHRIHWVIVGGESGPKARPMKEKWVREIQIACKTCRVPFFFKQWGAYDIRGRRVGKKRSGRELQGRTWNEMPVILSSVVTPQAM
jgi:protein gp37